MIAEQMLEKIIKSVKKTMQDHILSQQELHQLCMSNNHQEEKKKTEQTFIQDEESLADDERLQSLQKRETV